jgi:hypothetical protein
MPSQLYQRLNCILALLRHHINANLRNSTGSIGLIVSARRYTFGFSKSKMILFAGRV